MPTKVKVIPGGKLDHDDWVIAPSGEGYITIRLSYNMFAKLTGTMFKDSEYEVEAYSIGKLIPARVVVYGTEN